MYILYIFTISMVSNRRYLVFTFFHHIFCRHLPIFVHFSFGECSSRAFQSPNSKSHRYRGRRPKFKVDRTYFITIKHLSGAYDTSKGLPSRIL